MSERADALRQKLIRNFDAIPKQRELRPPLYDTECARLGAGTAAEALGVSIDILAPGMRGCLSAPAPVPRQHRAPEYLR